MTQEIDITEEELPEDIEREAEKLLEEMEEGDCDCPACQRAGEIAKFGYQRELLDARDQRARLYRVNRRTPVSPETLTEGEDRPVYDSVEIEKELEDVKIDVEKIVEELDDIL